MAKPFREALASGKFLVTASVDPPKGADLESVRQVVLGLKDRVDAVGVSDNHNGIMCMSPWAVCKMAQDEGVESIMHLACRDRNRVALQSDLLAAASMGITNILCVSGDHMKFGDHVDAKSVHDIDSVHLLAGARGLREGNDMAGNPLIGPVDFCLGAVANPGADPLEPQLIKVGKKIKAGAEFLITHPVFSVDQLKRFMDHLGGSEVKVLAGIRLLFPEEIEKYRDGSYPGLFIPEPVLEEIEGADMGQCINMAGALLGDIKSANLCAGAYIFAPQHEGAILDLL
jgi:5,10-methylenetetrahydrofolate reductase